MSFEFVQQRRVEFAETDMAGIVHFANFFRWMESTEHAFLRSLGSSVHAADAAHTTGWPRVKVGCEYQKPLRFEEVVEVALSVREVRTRSVCYGFEFRRAESREVVATGEVVAVHAALQPALGRIEAAPIPPALREILIERSQT
jgi:YbgC/YbaW family acyl-CoA thioester hydrolase